jgi:hypothetical protein
MAPPPAPPANDHTTLFGVLGIVLGVCLWPAGLVFSLLAMNAAGRAGKPKTLGVIGLILTILAAIFSIYRVATL